MPTRDAFKEWQDLLVDNMLGGLVLDADTEVLEKNELVVSDSWVIRNKQFRRDSGYEAYLGSVRGNPRRQVAYFIPSGALHELLITDLTVYRSVNGQWRYVSDGTQTTLNANEAGGSTAMNVADITGFADTDHIGIVLDDGTMHMTQVSGAPAAGIINITTSLPSAAASGNSVVRAVVLAGSSNRHVTTVALPWNEWLVFTNGINNVKRFDPTALTVVDVPGLTDTTCQTLALFDNSLILCNTTESGTRFPFRYRYSAKGDATAWATLEAGFTDILDSAHDIVQALPLGPYLILYRDKSIARVIISNSGTKRFDTQTTVAGVGIFSSQGVIDLIDRHVVWGNDDFYWYKGGFSVEPIGSPIKDNVFGPAGQLTHIKQTRGEAFAVLLPKNNEILFIHHVDPESAHPNQVLRYYLDYNKWNHRTFAHTFSGWGTHIVQDAKTWDSISESWAELASSWAAFDGLGEVINIMLLAADNDQAYFYDYESGTDGGTPITAVAETKDFSHPSYQLLHDYVDIGIGNGTVTVEYSLDKGATWNALGVVIAGASPQRFRLHKQFSSRVFRYRFTTTDNAVITYFNTRFKYEWEI